MTIQRYRLVVISMLISQNHGFHSTRGVWRGLKSPQPMVSSSVERNAVSDVLGGVSEFEDWWRESVSPCSLKHKSFENENLRGLAFKNENIERDIVTVPRDFVLRAPLTPRKDELDWDTNLALQLLKECEKGKKSKIFGYCALLMYGTTFSSDTIPPSTAPFALRNWPLDQKDTLNKSTAGKKLIEMEQRQTAQWKSTYHQTLSSSLQTQFSEGQFLWAMEAVHSRAFRGDFGPLMSMGRVPILSSVVLQVLASVVGFQQLMAGTPTNNTDGIVLACAVAALLPVFLFNVLGSNESAVLLPLIDSANHFAEADSAINYDPFNESFGLTLGENCVGADGQVFISYGRLKSNEELVLNYGFLPGVSMEQGNKDDFVYRNALIKKYIE